MPKDAFNKAYDLEKPILVYVYNTLPADSKIDDLKNFEEKILSDDTVYDFIDNNFTLIKTACKTPVKLKPFDKAKALERLKKQLTKEKLTDKEKEQLEMDKIRKDLDKESLPDDLIDYGNEKEMKKVMGMVTVDARKVKEYKKRVFPETEISAYSDSASLYICAFDGEIYFRVSTKATPADLLKMLKKAKKKNESALAEE